MSWKRADPIGRSARSLGVIALVAVGCSGGASQGSASQRTSWQSKRTTDAEFEAGLRVLDHVNRERSGVGLPPLSWASNAAATAIGYSVEMRETRTIGGVPESEGAPDRVFVAKAENIVGLQHVALVRDLAEVHRGLMASPEGRAALLSGSATHAGIGIVFGGEVSGRRKVFVTVFVLDKPVPDAVAEGEAPAADGAPAPPPASSTPPPEKVPPTLLEGWRIAGSPAIVPDDDTKTNIMKARQTKLIGSFKLCLAVDGTVASVELLKTTRFPAYDAKIMREMRGWRYRPYEVDGKAVPVCTAVTFVYTQR